jgi:transposase
MAESVRARRLTDQEGSRLQQIVRRSRHGSIRVRRALITMASASGTPVPAIARLVAADEDTVRNVVHAFNEKGLAALDPQWAGGRPRLISDDDIQVIVTAATTRPEKLGLPFTHWSVRKLAAYLADAPGRWLSDGTAAADPARARHLLPAHQDLEGVRRPGPGCQAEPDRARDHAFPGPVLRVRPVRAVINPPMPRHRLGTAEETGPAAGDLSPRPRHPLLRRLLLPVR